MSCTHSRTKHSPIGSTLIRGIPNLLISGATSYGLSTNSQVFFSQNRGIFPWKCPNLASITIISFRQNFRVMSFPQGMEVISSLLYSLLLPLVLSILRGIWVVHQVVVPFISPMFHFWRDFVFRGDESDIGGGESGMCVYCLFSSIFL